MESLALTRYCTAYSGHITT